MTDPEEGNWRFPHMKPLQDPVLSTQHLWGVFLMNPLHLLLVERKTNKQKKGYFSVMGFAEVLSSKSYVAQGELTLRSGGVGGNSNGILGHSQRFSCPEQINILVCVFSSLSEKE